MLSVINTDCGFCKKKKKSRLKPNHRDYHILSNIDELDKIAALCLLIRSYDDHSMYPFQFDLIDVVQNAKICTHPISILLSFFHIFLLFAKVTSCSICFMKLQPKCSKSITKSGESFVSMRKHKANEKKKKRKLLIYSPVHS